MRDQTLSSRGRAWPYSWTGASGMAAHAVAADLRRTSPTGARSSTATSRATPSRRLASRSPDGQCYASGATKFLKMPMPRLVEWRMRLSYARLRRTVARRRRRRPRAGSARPRAVAHPWRPRCGDNPSQSQPREGSRVAGTRRWRRWRRPARCWRQEGSARHPATLATPPSLNGDLHASPVAPGAGLSYDLFGFAPSPGRGR